MFVSKLISQNIYIVHNTKKTLSLILCFRNEDSSNDKHQPIVDKSSIALEHSENKSKNEQLEDEKPPIGNEETNTKPNLANYDTTTIMKNLNSEIILIEESQKSSKAAIKNKNVKCFPIS